MNRLGVILWTDFLVEALMKYVCFRKKGDKYGPLISKYLRVKNNVNFTFEIWYPGSCNVPHMTRT